MGAFFLLLEVERGRPATNGATPSIIRMPMILELLWTLLVLKTKII